MGRKRVSDNSNLGKRVYLKYTEELGEYVLQGLEDGKTLTAICFEYNQGKTADGGTLKQNSIHKWKRDHPEFKIQYDIAYESKLQFISEYMEWLAAQPPEETGDHKRDNLLLTQRKNYIDTLKFKLATLNAAHFKQAITVHHENIPQIVVTSYATSVLLDDADEDKEGVH